MKALWRLMRDVGLGVVLITAAAFVLLGSDLDRRHHGVRTQAGQLPRLAIMQWASTSLLDDVVAGIVEGLQAHGIEDGETAVMRFYNASGDSSTGNLMARELSSGRYDMVLTASTLALQAVAAANRDGRVMHIFGGVTDPYGAGVGITGPEPHQHPPHLVGVGTFQPVEKAIRVAHQMNPQLRRLGVVWTPSEDNSEACVRIARVICAELGIDLIEANASSTTEVPEAVRSVLSRGVDAIWVGGDTVAISAIRSIVAAARAEGVPVFTNDPSDVQHGALFGLGASYRMVGQAVGELGGQILRGADPMSFGVENLVPEVLALKEDGPRVFPAWSYPAEVMALATAVQIPAMAPLRRPAVGRIYRVGILYVGPHPVFEIGLQGVREGLAEAGFVEGENLLIEEMHPNDDFSIFPQVVRRLRDRNPDVIIPLSTPALVAALGGDDRIPIVFGIVSAPIEAGAGSSYEDHLPHVTGAVWTAPSPYSFHWMNELFPRMRRLGTVYNPSHANSLVQIRHMRELSRAYGWELVERSISTPSDITTVMQSLLAANPDVVYAMAENTVVSAFASVVQACRQARVPLVATDNSLMGSGALFSVGGSPLLEGRNTGRLAARVLLGESPAGIPFSPSTEQEVALDFGAAQHLRMSFPVGLLEQADLFHHLHAFLGRPARLALLIRDDPETAQPLQSLLAAGLRASGIHEGRDYALRVYSTTHHNAEEWIGLVPDVVASRPDVILLMGSIRSGDREEMAGAFSEAVDRGLLLSAPVLGPHLSFGYGTVLSVEGDGIPVWVAVVDKTIKDHGVVVARKVARAVVGVPPASVR